MTLTPDTVFCTAESRLLQQLWCLRNFLKFWTLLFCVFTDINSVLFTYWYCPADEVVGDVGSVCCQVNESERERLESELEHMKVAQRLNEAEQRVKKLQRDWKRNIAKSRQIFLLSLDTCLPLFVSLLDWISSWHYIITLHYICTSYTLITIKTLIAYYKLI